MCSGVIRGCDLEGKGRRVEVIWWVHFGKSWLFFETLIQGHR
jgi:hypothetical protein